MQHFLSQDELNRTGLLQEVNREFFHPLGFNAIPTQVGTLRVQDLRKKPEGVVFKEQDMIKRWNFIGLRVERIKGRLQRLGFVRQPLRALDK